MDKSSLSPVQRIPQVSMRRFLGIPFSYVLDTDEPGTIVALWVSEHDDLPTHHDT